MAAIGFANRRRGNARTSEANDVMRAVRPVSEFMGRPGFNKLLELRSRQIPAPKARESAEIGKGLDRSKNRAANRIARVGDKQCIQFSPCYTTRMQLSGHHRNSCSAATDAFESECRTPWRDKSCGCLVRQVTRLIPLSCAACRIAPSWTCQNLAADVNSTLLHAKSPVCPGCLRAQNELPAINRLCVTNQFCHRVVHS